MNKMHTSRKKLELNRETLRALANTDLRQAGAAGSFSFPAMCTTTKGLDCTILCSNYCGA
jgi:hypothetical protein